MSRSGYTDDYDEDGTGGLWRGAVHRAIAGKRGQSALRELAAAMDAMPVKALAAESLVSEDGEFCALGVLGQARGLDMAPIDPDDWDAVAKAFGIASAMVREIVFENDEAGEYQDSQYFQEVEIMGPVRPFYPEYGSHIVEKTFRYSADEVAQRRWARMRKWVESHIAAQAQGTTKGAA